MIEALDVTVRMGSKTVLHNVSLTAQAGEMTAIVGPNGSGKTTTLKAIAGELACDGRVLIGGDDIGSLQPWQLATRRAVLPQASVIAFPFTVREIVRMGLTVGASSSRGTAARAGHGSADRIAEEALEAVDLGGFAGRLYQELSGGEQQRVQLARALSQIWEPVRDGCPAFLLLDEPVSSLDIRHQLTVMRLAADYCRRGGGVVAVMHDLNLTAMFADHVVMMKEGRVVAAGAPRAVMTDEMMETVFGCAMRVSAVPPSGMPFVLPQTTMS
ncbi:iron ABC transporter [Rhizobium sp. Leaf384]|uniref:heme ABC transporter ATP-binding protein n=1 Tax=unclassified Rhizobium TaxID=2613769 RepID=UPI000715F46A|nr:MULTISPECIES: heme ABC transporter ATP-binding protein [unclassified Rhizobium]KQR69511.1 iron ABC transporter [Rhizobium sp. Leaf341]KQS77215.1 iron ABC transporter [Rhizobium sp. Leaf384]KQS78595.1 iron ABC transporter [Rhizobium sp. Leaf383]